jgi:type II secretory pathway pseudopilin PulG
MKLRFTPGVVFSILAVLALFGLFWWQQHRMAQERAAREKAEMQAGLRASEVLSAVFELAPAVRVARLTGNVQSRGECQSGYVFSNAQRTVAPYAVNYFVDLKGVTRRSYRWDVASKTMIVEVPEPSVEQPSVDMGKARSAQSGMYVSRACGLAMQRQVAGRLQAAANVKANEAQFIQQARDAARGTIAGLTRRPLAAAGIRDITVQVRFPSDSQSDEQMDRSTPITEIYAKTG